MPPKPTTPKKTKKQLEDEKKRLEERKLVVEQALELLYDSITESFLRDEMVPPVALELSEEFKVVEVDPLNEIGIMDARNVTDLHLGSRKMTEIHQNMAKLVNLEELWLHNNKLKSVANLFYSPSHSTAFDTNVPIGCKRIKRLYLHKNRIVSLFGSDITRLRFLEILLLHENNLSNLDSVLDCLKGLKYLTQLTLFGNPLEKDQPKKLYRMKTISSLTCLKVFDRIEIEKEEREEATNALPTQNQRMSIVRDSRWAFGKTLPHQVQERRNEFDTMKRSILGGTAEMAIKEAKKIVKERKVMEKRKDEEKKASMHKVLIDSFVKQYRDMEEMENQMEDKAWERLHHIYRDFEGLTTDAELVVIRTLIKNFHPTFSGDTFKLMSRELTDGFLDGLNLRDFTNSWISNVEQTLNEGKFVTEEDRKKVSYFKKELSKITTNFQDFYQFICNMKSEQEFVNSHSVHDILEKKKTEYESKRKERLDREAIQQVDRPKSGGKSKQVSKKPTDKTEEEEKEWKLIEEMEKNSTGFELQAASRAIKWQTKSQIHESLRPKEIKVVPKRGDIYKTHYL